MQDKGWHVIITVVGDCDHVLGKYLDTVQEKYPFYCGECEDEKRDGKYPWWIRTQPIYCNAETINLDNYA